MKNHCKNTIINKNYKIVTNCESHKNTLNLVYIYF